MTRENVVHIFNRIVFNYTEKQKSRHFSGTVEGTRQYDKQIKPDQTIREASHFLSHVKPKLKLLTDFYFTVSFDEQGLFMRQTTEELQDGAWTQHDCYTYELIAAGVTYI